MTNEELLKENVCLKQRIRELERSQTEHKRVEEALIENEGQYRSLVDNAYFGINVIDMDFKIMAANSVSGRHYKKPATELIGKYCYQEFEKRMAVCPHCPAVAAMATGRPHQAETEAVRDDGSRFHVRVHAFPLFDADGSPKGFHEIVEDITERKRAEVALTAGNKLFSTVFNASPAAISITRLRDEVLVDVNKAWEQASGLSREAAIGRTTKELNIFVDPKDREYLIEEVTEKGGVRDFETKLRRTDGNVNYVLLAITRFDISGEHYVLGISQDITYRKQIEEALRQSESRFRDIAQINPVAIYETDDTYRLTFANHRALDLFGYSNEDLETGLDSISMIVPEDRGRMMENLTRRLLGEDPGSNEYTGLKKNGDTFPLLMQGIPTMKAGRLTGIRGAMIDITELKRAEAALLESETRFKSYAEQAFAGIYLLQDDVFKYVNPKFAQMFGYMVEECLDDMHFENLIYAEDIDHVREQIRKRIAGEVAFAHYTFRGMKKNGHIFDVEIYGSVGVHSGKPAAAGTILDITDRNLTLKALQKSEEKTRLLIENSHDIIYQLSLDGVFLFVSPAVIFQLGYAVDQLIGKPFQDIVHPDDVPVCLASLQSVIKAGQRQSGIEYRIRHTDGTWYWHMSNIVPFKDETGRVLGFYGISSDITDRKQREEERLQIISELQKALSEVKKLSGMLPICSSCKKIRDDKGYWNQIESFIREHSEAEFSHSLCPECVKKLYPDVYERMQADLNT